MTEVAIEEAQRLLRIAVADFAACRALLNPYAVVFRYDDIEVELLTRPALIEMVEAILQWVTSELNSMRIQQ
mgnify:CR=1 FL=1